MSTLRDSREIEATPHWQALLQLVADIGPCVVAFSGGVDSTLLAKVAHDVLGDDALAVTAVSPSLSPAEREDARRLAELIGIAHHEVLTREAEDERYVANAPDRCHACKTHLFTAIEALLRESGARAVTYGATLDDLGEHRPGMVAAAEHGVRGPLLEAGLGKAEIREASRRLGLPTWDKPALACLASRIPHGTRVTPQRLDQVDRAEASVRALGFAQVRVRHLGRRARVEVEPADVPRALALQGEISRGVTATGFEDVEIDPTGYRPGKLNALAPSGTGAGSQE